MESLYHKATQAMSYYQSIVFRLIKDLELFASGTGFTQDQEIKYQAILQARNDPEQ